MKPAKRITALAAAAVVLAFPVSAQATLVFVRGLRVPVVWAAADDGTGGREIGNGMLPKVSPDGQKVVYERERRPGDLPELMVAVTNGELAPWKLLRVWRQSPLVWSPDSTRIAVVVGSDRGRKALVVVKVSEATAHTVATGYFSGVSFSPDGESLVYAVSQRERFPAAGDLYVASAAKGGSRRLTRDHRAMAPLWGPSGRIVFSRQVGSLRRRYVPKNELFLISPDGTGLRRLTRTKVPRLAQGLFPTDWSADGSKLLAEFTGQDLSYAVAVDPMSGSHRAVLPSREQCPGKMQCRSEPGSGFVGTALSSDGTTVLGYAGGTEPGPDEEVATVPYPGSGGKPRVLARNAFSPDWSR